MTFQRHPNLKLSNLHSIINGDRMTPKHRALALIFLLKRADRRRKNVKRKLREMNEDVVQFLLGLDVLLSSCFTCVK